MEDDSRDRSSEDDAPADDLVGQASPDEIRANAGLPGDAPFVADDLSDDEPQPRGWGYASGKVRKFPQTPGIYLMKDAAGVVIYVGKAKNLRNRASSYFLKAALEDPRTGVWVQDIADIDFLECESEVDALLTESRLIKDIQPKHNKEQKDDKTFPYLQITTYEPYPRVEITREPRTSGVKLYGPFTSVGALRGAMQALQRVFKFRTCSLDIDPDDQKWRWFRPCLLASIDQCTAPCNFRSPVEEYKRDIKRLQQFLDGNKKRLVKQMTDEMHAAAEAREFEKAAKLRDEIRLIERLEHRGELDEHAQPEVFYVDPKKGLSGLRKALKLERTPRTIEGMDIAHLGGSHTVASVVTFLDGLPFKPGYRRYKIRTVAGVDDFRSMHEVVSRRFQRLSDEDRPFPDILLIDGGKGQLNAAVAAFKALKIDPPTLISLAKREELIFRPGEAEPLRLTRRSFALRLLQYVRDESHRFAQHYHHLLKRKADLE